MAPASRGSSEEVLKKVQIYFELLNIQFSAI